MIDLISVVKQSSRYGACWARAARARADTNVLLTFGVLLRDFASLKLCFLITQL